MSMFKSSFAVSETFGFDSEQSPITERFEIVRDLLGQVFPGYELASASSGFRIGLRAWQVGDVMLGQGSARAVGARFGSATVRRNKSESRCLDTEGTLWIFQRGQVNLRQGSVDGGREGGSAWFMNADVPGYGETSGIDVLAINIPKRALRRALGHNRHLGSLALERGHPLIPLLTGYAESAKALPQNVDPTLRSAIGGHLTDLVALALRPNKDAAEQAMSRGLKSARVDAIVKLIGENFADPGFSVSDVASRLRVSVRYVQDILQETGTGFSERVLELRLQEAARLLAVHHQTNRKVSDIAFSCGFNNLSYFHRAFRRRFGMTPAGCRSP